MFLQCKFYTNYLAKYIYLSNSKLVFEPQDSKFESSHEPLLGGNLFALNP